MWAAAEADSLLPLLEAEMDALAHPPGAPSARQVSGLAPASSRAAQGPGRAPQRCAAPAGCQQATCAHACI